MLTSVILLAALGILSAGCASNNFATLDAAGKALPQAQYQVLGQTRYDQTWIDKTIEAEVAGFGMKRPVARPASLKSAPKSTKVVVRPATPAAGPSSGGAILLPTPRSETQQPSPAKPETITVARPAKKSTTQRLRAELEALKVKIRKLEGR